MTTTAIRADRKSPRRPERTRLLRDFYAPERLNSRALDRTPPARNSKPQHKILARRGEHVEAEQLAREAVTITHDTDRLNMQGDAYTDLAEVLLLAGKPDHAGDALENALDRYQSKQNLAMAAQVRKRLAQLREQALPA